MWLTLTFARALKARPVVLGLETRMTYQIRCLYDTQRPSRKYFTRLRLVRVSHSVARTFVCEKESFPSRVLFVSTPVTRGANDAAVAS